jgi:hypothetical protein
MFGDTPSENRERLIATLLFAVACMAIIGYATFSGKRAVIPVEEPEKADSTQQPLTLEQLSHLDQKAFEHSLPQLRQVIEQPSPIPAPNEATLTAIAQQLRQTEESTPDYWPTVLRFLQFASSRMAPTAPPPGQRSRALTDILSVGIMRGIREEGKTILFDDGDLGNGVFIKCRIILTQNAVQMHNVVFRNCAFELPATDSPSQYLRKVSQILLASNLSVISIATLR